MIAPMKLLPGLTRKNVGTEVLGGITLLAIALPLNIGYALWNFRGSFGIIDSARADVAYEDWHGCKLDRELLELLRAH